MGLYAPWFICWFRCYINRLFAYLTYLLIYLFTSLRIDPFHTQAGGRKRWANLALVFCVYFVLQYILWQMYVSFCCVQFSFSVLSQEIGPKKNLSKMTILCRVGRKICVGPSYHWYGRPSLDGQTISLYNQAPRTTQPVHHFMDRHSACQQKLEPKRAQTNWCASPISVVSLRKLVSGWRPQKWRSVLLYGPKKP